MRICALLALCALAPAGPSLESRIGAGVQRGVDFLLSRYDAKEAWGKALGTGVYGGVGRAYPYAAGPTSLVCFALLKAGVPNTHPTLRKAFSFMRVNHRLPGVAYEISIMLLAVAELGGASKSPDFRRGGLREQRTTHRFRKPKDSPFKTRYWTWMADLTKKLLSFQSSNGGWRYYPRDFHSGGRADTSSTQFALLALLTASRCGYDVPREVFERARRFLIATQMGKGRTVPRAIHVPGGDADATDRARGFPYIAASEIVFYRRVSGGMTAAGVASMLLVRDELGEDAELQQAILDGFAWLGRYFTVQVNPGYAPFSTGSYHFTYLYAFERCGDIARREVVGGRSWFSEGARHLLGRQRKDGAIVDPTCMNPKDTLGTAFALLFLTRASRPISGG